MPSPTARRDLLKAVYDEAMGCVRCPLHESRTTVVFGAGNADAELMFIGEAPGANEDKQGLPFVGQAGKLLDKLLGEIGMERRDVFVANVLKCLSDDAQVQLGDGSWERIGRLVRSHYGGEVMSVEADGSLVRRRVVGWHATPLAGRSVYRLTYSSAKRAGPGRIGIQLTGDHPVLTESGYVPVQALADGDRVATGQARLQPGPPTVMFDAVEVEDVTDRPRDDTTFFCIDVEQTHNFVTAGGVVHNCRPPGNRDPHPTEIETCQRYLWRQVELIEPTVICTLGNFSTKLLRGDPTGISRLHGVEEKLVVGARAVRLYPLFHPAAALYTPRMLEILRADFRRLPEVLALGPLEQPDLLPPTAEAARPEFIEAIPEIEPEPPEPPPEVQLGLF